MERTALPTETLQQIFSCSTVTQFQLTVLCRVNKRFCDIVKLYLYRSITIRSYRAALRFKRRVRPEDSRLVKTVRIEGKSYPWEILKLQKVHDAFEKMDKGKKQRKEVAEAVRMLLEGRLVNPDQIETIFIYNVLEDPTVLWHKVFKVTPKLFANLRNLSIVCHRGGFNIWGRYLSNYTLPKLENLVLHDNTAAHPGRSVIVDGGSWVDENGDVQETYREVEAVELKYRMLLTLSRQTPLKLLVSGSMDVEPRSYNFLLARPSFSYLISITRRNRLWSGYKYVIFPVFPEATARDEARTVLLDLSIVVEEFSRYSLKYLALPANSKRRLTKGDKRALKNLRKVGVAVYYDGDLGRSIAPPSFLEFRKKEQEEEERSRRESSE